MEKEQNKFSNITIFLMIFTALCFDGIQTLVGWIPVFGNVLAGLLSIFVFLTFFLWFKIHGITMTTPKRLTAMLGGGVVEIIPFINILPAWTCVVIYLIGTTKIRELVEKHPGLTKGAVLVGGKIKN